MRILETHDTRLSKRGQMKTKELDPGYEGMGKKKREGGGSNLQGLFPNPGKERGGSCNDTWGTRPRENEKSANRGRRLY